MASAIGFGDSGSVVYAKPTPIVTSPWGDDVVLGTEDGTTGRFAFTVSSGITYRMYQRLGASPASSDLYIGDLVDLVVSIAQGSAAADGTISEIIIGDTYLDANGRAFSWTFTAPTGIAIGDCSFHFGGEATGNRTGSWLVVGSLADAGSGNWTGKAELLESSTIDCEPGLYMWSAAVHGPAGEKITKVKSRTHKVQLVSKQTE